MRNRHVRTSLYYIMLDGRACGDTQGSGFWGIERLCGRFAKNLRKLDAAGRLIKSRRCQVND